jgi:bifunctional non-homologous end joining protein LigD
MPPKYEYVEIAGREVRISNPDKVFFPDHGITKFDLVRYYVAVMEGALRGGHDRPTTMYRWPNGVQAPDDAFYQKRVPDKGRPEWLETATVRFPSGRSASMLVLADGAHLLYAVNLGCLDLNPWPVRKDDLDHPDELRVDLDPTPDIPFDHVRQIALLARDVLEEHGFRGWPKSSGKRGIHIYVRILPEYDFTEARRAALAFAREVERRSEGMATTAWWKEERVGVFVDYNQNARDRTIASAYSVRPTPDARVSCPLSWDEVAGVEPETLTLRTVPERLASIGDPSAGIDDDPRSIDPLLDLARRDEEGGLGDAPWPPHFPKAKGEPRRVQPSKRRPD